MEVGLARVGLTFLIFGCRLGLAYETQWRRSSAAIQLDIKALLRLLWMCGSPSLVCAAGPMQPVLASGSL